MRSRAERLKDILDDDAPHHPEYGWIVQELVLAHTSLTRRTAREKQWLAKRFVPTTLDDAIRLLKECKQSPQAPPLRLYNVATKRIIVL